MACTAQQARRDLINVQRLVARLEGAAGTANNDGNEKDYYATLAVLSNIRYAKEMVQHADGSSNTRNDLNARLDALQAKYKAMHESIPTPASTNRIHRDLEALRPKALALSEEPAEALSPAIENDLLPLEHEEALSPSAASARMTSRDAVPTLSPSTQQPKNDYSTFTPKDTPTASTRNITTLLSHHRSEQETLTEELASMATRLKENSLQFSNLLQTDKALMENAEEKLEKNLNGMMGQQSRLKGYSKKAGVSFWFTIGAVIAVTLAWFFMFGLMRVA